VHTWGVTRFLLINRRGVTVEFLEHTGETDIRIHHNAAVSLLRADEGATLHWSPCPFALNSHSPSCSSPRLDTANSCIIIIILGVFSIGTYQLLLNIARETTQRSPHMRRCKRGRHSGVQSGCQKSIGARLSRHLPSDHREPLVLKYQGSLVCLLEYVSIQRLAGNALYMDRIIRQLSCPNKFQ